MTDQQNEIYKGLNSFGKEIAQFYSDGIQIIGSPLGSKSYLLGHILREIDGGLRGIFELKSQKIKFSEEIKDEDLELLFDEFKEEYKNYDYLKDVTLKEFQKAKNHISSIVVSFGLGMNNPLTKQYIKITLWLHKYAHRSGAYNNPRDPKDIINIWNEFENVLAKLIGNYYAISDRLDTILKMELPTEEVMKTLPNLLLSEARSIYFFDNLKHPNWLAFFFNNGYFNGALNPQPIEVDENPGYFIIPRWNILLYLELVAGYNSKEENEKISKLLVSIIDEISNYKTEDGKRIKNFRTDYSLFTIICYLPENYLKEEHFSFILDVLKEQGIKTIGHNYGKLLDRLLRDEKKLFIKKGIEILLDFREFKGNALEEIESIFENYTLSIILSEYKDLLINNSGINLLQIAIRRIHQIISFEGSSFSNLSLPAIENHEQTFSPENFDCQLAYIVRDCLEILPISEIIDTINLFLKEDHPIFRRLVVHTIRMRYRELSKMFWRCEGNPLDHVASKHEVFELIKQHSKTFSVDQLEQILKWIDNKQYYIPEEWDGQTERIEKSIAYRKKEWLLALSEMDNEEISNRLDDLNRINDSKVEHPGFDTWHSSQIGNLSPLTSEEILAMNLEEIINYFDNSNTNERRFMEPSIEGLSDALVFTIRKNPNVYNVNCEIVSNSSHYFMYTWIRGLAEAWKEEKLNFQTDEVLEVILKIVNNIDFWKLHNSVDKHGRWFISSVLSFLDSGVNDDSHAFEEKNLLLIKRIIIQILKMHHSEVVDHQDLSMTVLNNSVGHLYMVMIEYSYRLARVENKISERWDVEIKEIISSLLDSKEENPMLYHVLGQYLSHVNFLDEEWFLKNFNNIFPADNEVNLLSSLSGYLFYNRQPNRTHFDLFIKNRQYLIALSNKINLADQARDGLVSQICLAYLYDFNGTELDGELMQALFTQENEDVFSYLVYFFWSPKRPFETKVTHKIIPIWETLFNNSIKLQKPQIDKLILSGSCKWVNSVTKIDENVKSLLVRSIPYISQRDRYAVIEGLFKHINTEPQKVGEILFELFKIEVTYDISRGHISDMILVLYQHGFKDIADKICLIHAEKGIDFLKDIYKKYNP